MLKCNKCINTTIRTFFWFNLFLFGTMQLPLEIINASLVSHLFPSLESSFHFTICELFSTYRARSVLVKYHTDAIFSNMAY